MSAFSCPHFPALPAFPRLGIGLGKVWGIENTPLFPILWGLERCLKCSVGERSLSPARHFKDDPCSLCYTRMCLSPTWHLKASTHCPPGVKDTGGKAFNLFPRPGNPWSGKEAGRICLLFICLPSQSSPGIMSLKFQCVPKWHPPLHFKAIKKVRLAIIALSISS